MSPLARLAVLFAALSLAPAAAAAAPFPGLTDLHALAVKAGVNRVPAMTADGREGLIVEGFKTYFNADGSHDTFMVLTHTSDRDTPWTLVTTGASKVYDPDAQEVLDDTPHTGEDFVGSVRFARARLNGLPVFVLLLAHRDMEGPIPAPSHVTIRLYTLEKADGQDGDHFLLQGEFKPAACYGDSDLALYKEVGLALPKGYEGPDAAKPCGVYP